MSRIKTWHEHLTKSELVHLMEVGVTDLASLERTLAVQQKLREESDVEPCWDCRFIRDKLANAGVL